MNINPEVRTILEKLDWVEIAEKLAVYATFKVQKAYWRTGKGTLPKGLEIEDFAYNAIDSLWTGQRHWNPDKEPDVMRFLKGVVDSEVSHLLESPEHLRREHAEAREPDQEDPIKLIADLDQDPLGEIQAKEMWDHLKQSAEGDNDMQLILYCLEEGITRRADIIDTLQLSPAVVDGKLKKIRKDLKKFLENNEE